jgi:drug/metabolite transporter (DMT)-like permease
LSIVTAFAFAVASSLCWAGLDATRKLLASRVSAVALVIVLSLGQLPFHALWWASDPGGIELVPYAAPGALEIVLNVVANLLFVRAVEVSPLSLTIPFLSFTPVFATVIAVPVLHETPSLVQGLGIGAVVLGALLLSSGRAVDLGLRRSDVLGALARERGALYMIVVALAWATTITLDKTALAHAALPVHAAIQNGGVGLILLLYLLGRRRGRELAALTHAPVPFAATVAFAAGGFAFQLLAIETLLVGVVETLKRAIGLVSALVLGRVHWHEPITPTKAAACVVMVAGTAALVMG